MIDKSFYEDIFEVLPAAVIWAEPVTNEQGVIEDFKIGFSNKKANEIIGNLKGSLVGLKIKNDGIPTHNLAKENFSSFLSVYENNKQEDFSFLRQEGVPVKTTRRKFNGGVLSTETTEVQNLQQAIQRQSSVSQSILDASLNGIYSLVAIRNNNGEITDFNYLFANAAIAQFLRLEASEMVGKSMTKLLPENRENGFFEIFCNVLASGKTVRDETHFANEKFDHWFQYVIVKMDEDTVVVTLQDITKLKQGALQIEQQKSMLDNIMKYSYSGISVSKMIRDEEGKVVDARTLLANDAAVNFIGLPKELYLSKTAMEIDPSIMGSPYYHKAMNTLETGEPSHIQYYLQPTARWLDISISKMDSEHIITIFTDVTETKNTQLQLEKYVEELKRSNANLEEFGYAASHDLKEPIRKINTFTSQLKTALATRLSEHETRIFERIQNSTTRMAQLIDDLLEYAHINFDSEQFERVDLNEKVSKVLVDLELVVQEKKAIIKVGKLPVVNAHRRQLGQLFQNLIGNALKYNKPGIIPEIVISSTITSGSEIGSFISMHEPGKQYYRIDIKDNGIGFDQQYEDRIFQIFQRLHGKAEYQGTGVGLAIVKKVVQNHNGFITVESEPGVGSTFKVYLPADK